MLPEASQRHFIAKHMPDADAEMSDRVIAYFQTARPRRIPYALLQPLLPWERLARSSRVYKGLNLESAMYLATLTGSGIHVDTDAHWEQLVNGRATLLARLSQHRLGARATGPSRDQLSSRPRFAPVGRTAVRRRASAHSHDAAAPRPFGLCAGHRLNAPFALMATSNSPTCGHSNSPRQDGRIMGFLTLSELTCEAAMPGAA
jgi:hypothetical protein